LSVLAVITAGNGTKRCTKFLTAGVKLFTLRKSKFKETEIVIAAVTAPIKLLIVKIFKGLLKKKQTNVKRLENRNILARTLKFWLALERINNMIMM
jgi:hypothetical protein